MPFVRTVLGDIAAGELGSTNAHEHLFIKDGLILTRESDFRLDSVPMAIAEVKDFVKFGGQAIVDTAPLSIGRHPEGLAEVSRQTGVHIIAATGFHKPVYYLDSHWRHRMTAEQIAELFIEEITDGMDIYSFEGPMRKRSASKAGVVKVAADYQKIVPAVMLAIEAAAMAHQRTGVPVLTHTEMGTMGMEQVEALGRHGVQPQHILLSHMDRNADWRLHRDIAQTGAFMEYDGPGRVKYLPEGDIIDLLRKMFDLGLGGQVTLGGDTARRSYWKANGGGPGMAYIWEVFVPRLRREGFTDAEIDALLIKNPARVLTFRQTTA